MKKFRIFLADDHVFIRAGLITLINAENDMEVVGEAADGAEAVEKIPALSPDVIVMDVSMPGIDGRQATQQVRAALPTARILALSMHEDRSNISELLAAGASGYLLKRAAAAELVTAIRAVAQGGLFLDPRIASKLVTIKQEKPVAEKGELSPRETEVLQCVARGYSHKEIAALLNVSLKTVETYKNRSMEKLRLKTRVDVIRHAAATGWLVPIAP